MLVTRVGHSISVILSLILLLSPFLSLSISSFLSPSLSLSRYPGLKRNLL